MIWLRCARCRGELEPSRHRAGYVHVDDRHDDHAPVLRLLSVTDRALIRQRLGDFPRLDDQQLDRLAAALIEVRARATRDDKLRERTTP